MKLLIKFPTRQRPDVFLNTLSKYVNLIDDKENYAVMISADVDDPTMHNQAMLDKILSFKNCNVKYGTSKTKIEAVNADMDIITDWDICLLASDDMIPQIQGYDNIIRELFKKHFPDGDGCLHINDGKTFDKLNTIVLLDRKRYERFGYLYHWSYNSLWCDNEFGDVNKVLGMPYIEQVIIKNESPDWGGVNPQDKLYIKNNRLFNVDKANYERRKALGFPAYIKYCNMYD